MIKFTTRPLAPKAPIGRVTTPVVSRHPATVSRPQVSNTSPMLVTNAPSKFKHGPVVQARAARRLPPARATIKPMAKKGVIAKTKSGTVGGGFGGSVSRIVSGGLSGIPIAGGLASSVFNELVGQGVPPAQAAAMAGRRRHKKGLTYNEIRGAVKVLKLVKRFAPAGHRTALRVKRARSRMY